MRQETKDRLTKDQVITIPNFLTLIRIIIIPFIIYYYRISYLYNIIIFLVALSGITDFLDGFIARKTKKVSELGQVLDPLADKCTQISLAYCLMLKYPIFGTALGILIMKEIVQLVLGYMVYKEKNIVNMAKWYGKIATAFFYFSVITLLVFPNIPVYFVNIMVSTLILLLILALILYILMFVKQLISSEDNKKINK